MKETYIFGHRNPDTDSICSSIAYSYLKNILGSDTEPVTLGELNDETKFVLDYFKVKKPKYINDVKLQLSDVHYNKDFYIKDTDSLYEAYNKMIDQGVTGIPVVDKDTKLYGMLTLKDIAYYLINSKNDTLRTSYENIVNTLEGKELTKFGDIIEGNLMVASYRSTYIKENVKFKKNSILVVADRHSVIEYAIESKIKLIILVGDAWIKEEHLELAKKHKINIIKTDLSSYYVSKRISLCNFNKVLINEKTNKPSIFYNYDYVKDFKNEVVKLKHTNYPIVDSKNRCLGMVRTADVDNNDKKKVILVDHNEASQSAVGLDEAEILEIVDHHKIGAINTKNPINFRNMAVGSTCTIVYELYKEHEVDINVKVAGLLLSGILSDTLVLKSPTTTEKDKIVVSELSKLLNIHFEEYGIEMYKAGVNIKDKSTDDIFFTDYKTFDINDGAIGIGQVMTLNIEDIDLRQKEFTTMLDRISKENELKVVAMFVTDIIKNGSYLYFNSSSKDILKDAFNLKSIKQGVFLDDLVSRKKQMVPKILDILE